MPIKKTEKELHEDLIAAASQTVNSYEEYLLDKLGWRELAQVMDKLRKSLAAIDKHNLSK
jgi:hypothetical protein